MTQVNISIYHILHFAHLIDRAFWSLEKLLEIGVFENDKNEDLRHMIQINTFNQILIHTTSLLDEYSDHFITIKATTIDEKGKVEQTRELLKPVFKKINEWKGLKEFRNNVLAHNLRDSKANNQSVFIARGISGYDIPERVRDFGFLIQCIDLIRQVLSKVFTEEYKITVEKIANLNEKTKDEIPLTNRNYEKEYLDLQNEILKIKRDIEARYQN